MSGFEVTFFWLGLSVTVLLGAITVAGWKHKALVYSLLAVAAIFFAFALAWPFLGSIGRAAQSFRPSWIAWLALTGLAWCVALYAKFGKRGPKVSLHDCVSNAFEIVDAHSSNVRMMPVVQGEIRSAFQALRRAKFPLPHTNTNYAQQCARAEFFMGSILPLIRDGHLDNAREEAAQIIADMDEHLKRKQEAEG